MAHSHSTMRPFRFLDLPRELRDQIYKILLCSFELPPSEAKDRPFGNPRFRNPGIYTNFCRAEHDIEASILGVCRQIHREAYEIMVKTNHFIKIQACGVGLSPLVGQFQIPIVTMDRDRLAYFRGYLLSVDLRTPPGLWLGEYEPAEHDDLEDFDPDCHELPDDVAPHLTFMIIGRDLPAFCAMLQKAHTHIADFSIETTITATLGSPASAYPDYMGPLIGYFNARNQENILKPFRQLRGFCNLEIRGNVSSGLQKAIESEVRQPQYPDAKKFIQALKLAKEAGNGYHRAGEYFLAVKEYTMGLSDYSNMRHGTSWKLLINEGGRSFINESGDLRIRLGLNMAQSMIKLVQTPEYRDAHTKRESLCKRAANVLEETREIPEDCNENGGSLTMSDEHFKKLNFRQAQCLRLSGDDEVSYDALDMIEAILNHATGDAAIEREHRLIQKWCDRVDREYTYDVDDPSVLTGFM